MKNNVPLDIRIVNYVNRKLNEYVNKKSERDKISSEKLWQEKFKSSDHIVHKLKEDIKIKLYKDSILSKLIYEGFENEEIDFLNAFLNEGDFFVDIGANVGLFSLYASRRVGPTGSVIAFEPSKLTYERLVENLELNGITNVRPYKLGLSDKDEMLELNISSNGHEAWNTFVPTRDNKFSLKEKVQVQAFDHFLREKSIDVNRISLVKLDVEGFEINVLKGSKDLLSNQNAPAFLVEFTDDNAISAGNCCHELYKLLLGFDYFWYTYDPIWKKLKEEPMRQSYPYDNLIAIKDGPNNKKFAHLVSAKS
jgi:FkbM family methyltransferase